MARPNPVWLFLPGAELMLAHSLHGSKGCGERQMLFQHLDSLSNTDLLLLDRGNPARRLIPLLNWGGIPFCMRGEKSGTGGFACVCACLNSQQREQIVTVRAHDRQDAQDYECPRKAQKVRLVRHVAPNGNIRVLMTNLLDTEQFPSSCFGDLYHQRWRIEEAFKRLKHLLILSMFTAFPGRPSCKMLPQKGAPDSRQRTLRSSRMIVQPLAMMTELTTVRHTL